MKDTTQANATAKTAFGCRNGLVAVPVIGTPSKRLARLGPGGVSVGLGAGLC